MNTLHLEVLAIENDRYKRALKQVARGAFGREQEQVRWMRGAAQCALEGRHVPEFHDMGGDYYCSRCCGATAGYSEVKESEVLEARTAPAKEVDGMEGDVGFWQARHTDARVELAEARLKALQENARAAELERERDALTHKLADLEITAQCAEEMRDKAEVERDEAIQGECDRAVERDAARAEATALREALRQCPAAWQPREFDRLFPEDNTLVSPWRWTAGDVRAIRRALAPKEGT